MKARNSKIDEPATTRKERAVWFYERSVFPLRDAALTELEKAWEVLAPQAHSETEFGTVQWEEMGPFNVAGRTTSLALILDTYGETIYAGSAGGGVWKRSSFDLAWTPCWDRALNHNIGALAIHPKQPERIIVATGEANMSPDGYGGSGFYFSEDCGKTWSPYFRHPDGSELSPEARKGMPRRVGAIVFDPFDVLLGAVGSVSHDERMVSGLYLLKFAEGMVPCTRWGTRSYNCHSVLFHPRERGWLYAAIEARGSLSGIWLSKDSGETWTQLKRGLPEGAEFGRTSLTVSRSSPDVFYALVADRRRRLRGVYRSSDSGSSWEQIAAPDDPLFASERFLSYNNTIVVHPDRDDFVIWGGACLYRKEQAGKPWTKITTSDRFQDPLIKSVKNANYAHEDHHALLMPRGDLIYSGNDGGVALSMDGGDTWDDWSRGLVTTMFYDVDVAPSNGKVFGGGAQDNGTLIAGVTTRDGAALEKGDFLQAFPGDGGWIAFDPDDEQKVFGSAQEFSIHRHKHPLPWDIWPKVSPGEDQVTEGERRQRAIAVLELTPGKDKKLWVGTNRLWVTSDEGNTWMPKTGPLDGSAISAIHVAAANPKVMFVGTTNGGIFRSKDGGETWTEDLGGPEIPRRLITRIETHPKNQEEVVVTVASTGVPGAQLLHSAKAETGLSPLIERSENAFEKTYSNVFQSFNMGDTWEDIDGGTLPNVVFHAITYDTCRPGLIYMAGDVGVFVKFDEGWYPLTANLPNVVISDLVFHDKNRTLTAATYGRGIWRLDTAALHFDGHPNECG